MNKHKSNKIKENSNTVRHLIMGQITTTQNLVAIKEVRHAGQWYIHWAYIWKHQSVLSECGFWSLVKYSAVPLYNVVSKLTIIGSGNGLSPVRCQVITLTHWGRVTHKCVSKLTIIGSDNGLSPGQHQAIIWTNAGILLIWTLGTNFSEILSNFMHFHTKKCIWLCRLRNVGHFVSTSMCYPTLTYCWLDRKEHISMKFYLKFESYHSRKCIWKCIHMEMLTILVRRQYIVYMQHVWFNCH